MTRYFVAAAYCDPPSLFGTWVDAETPDEAIDVAWAECCDGNGWPMDETVREDEWADVAAYDAETGDAA